MPEESGGRLQGFSITNFNAFRGEVGILRTHDYLVELPTIRGLSTEVFPNKMSIEEGLELTCDAVNFPLTSLDTYGVRYRGYGVTERRPTTPKFGPIQCTFVTDRQAMEYRYFQEWMKVACNYYNSENDTNSGTAQPYELSYRADYVVDFKLYMFDQMGNLIRVIKFREAFPVQVGDVQFSWGRLNELVKVPVTFQFTDWDDEVRPQSSDHPPVPPPFPKQ
jgi:hypothetical protein